MDRVESADAGRVQSIIVASWIGIVGNGLLAVAKLVVGVLSASTAVLSDGIDSAMDVVTSAISLVAARITARPPDLDHPYGHSRAETIATRALSFVIFFAGAQLAISTVGRIIANEPHPIPNTLALWVTIASIGGKVGLALHKFSVGKRTGSSMLIADAKNMRADIAISVAVLAGLAFTYLLHLPVLDLVTASLISFWIMYVAFRIFLEGNSELMEGYDEPETYQKLFDAVTSVPGANHPHRARIRRIGLNLVVDLDVEVDGSLTVTQAHAIGREIEQAIEASIDNVYDVVVHVEPLGNVENHERYGVSQRKLDADRNRRGR